MKWPCHGDLCAPGQIFRLPTWLSRCKDALRDADVSPMVVLELDTHPQGQQIQVPFRDSRCRSHVCSYFADVCFFCLCICVVQLPPALEPFAGSDGAKDCALSILQWAAYWRYCAFDWPKLVVKIPVFGDDLFLQSCLLLLLSVIMAYLIASSWHR